MATNLALDDRLIEEAMKMSGEKSKRDTVNKALEEFIKMMKRRQLAQLGGKIEIDHNYSFKKMRSR